jgi:hypothetical protein
VRKNDGMKGVTLCEVGKKRMRAEREVMCVSHGWKRKTKVFKGGKGE